MYRGAVAVVWNDITETWDVWMDNKEVDAKAKKSHAVEKGRTLARSHDKKLVIERQDGTTQKTIRYDRPTDERGGGSYENQLGMESLEDGL